MQRFPRKNHKMPSIKDKYGSTGLQQNSKFFVSKYFIKKMKFQTTDWKKYLQHKYLTNGLYLNYIKNFFKLIRKRKKSNF